MVGEDGGTDAANFTSAKLSEKPSPLTAYRFNLNGGKLNESGPR